MKHLPALVDSLVYRIAWAIWLRHLVGKLKDAKGRPLVLHPKQLATIRAIKRGATRVANCWGRRSGKTLLMALLAVVELAFKPTGNLPFRQIMITAPTADLTARVFNLIWKWVVTDRIFGVMPIAKSYRERYIIMPWGSRVDGKTTDNPESLLGEGVVLVLADEHARDKDDILDQYLEPSTFDTGGRIVISTTPKGRRNHFKKTYDDWQEMSKTSPLYYTSKATSYDNPALLHERIENYKAACIRRGRYDLFLQEVMAEFTALAGAIFKYFSPEKDGKEWHVKAGLKPIPGVAFVLGLDWGFRHPFSCLLAQIIGSDRIRVYRQIHETGLSDSKCLKRVMEMLREMKVKPENIDAAFCDPSRPGSMEDLEDLGVPVYWVDSEDRSRYTSFEDAAALINDTFSREDEPAFEIDSSCTALIDEFEDLEWSEKGKQNKPAPGLDDSVASCRYMIQGAVGLGLDEPLFMSY